jgi:hypothetical protein
MTNETTISPTAIPNAPLPKLDAVHSKLNASLAKALEVTDRVIAYGRGNIDATLHGNRIWAEGTRAIRDRVLSAVKTTGRQTVETGKALAAARSPEAFVAAQANGVRASVPFEAPQRDRTP